jgi:predicted nucleic acid-binding protein
VEALQATGVIKVKSFDDVELKKVRAFQHARSLGIEDQSVLFLAHALKAVLLTSDKKLRAEASAAQVRAVGILGILDELLLQSIITHQSAAEKLRSMMDQGAFLPLGECEKRLELWLRTT